MSATKQDYIILGKRILPSGCCLISLMLKSGENLPPISPGQFVQIKIDAPKVFLRRPISVCDIRYGKELVIFVKPMHEGTHRLCAMESDETLNIIGPLGTGFTVSDVKQGEKVLLVGGGVGAAPLVYLSRVLYDKGADVTVVLGGRSAKDVDGVDKFYENASKVMISTDDGSLGEHGLIINNSVFSEKFDRIYCCGPTPMMKAVAALAEERNIWCEVSLEGSMACGIGACLCCVQKTADNDNVCVCTSGPVFNIKKLMPWT